MRIQPGKMMAARARDLAMAGGLLLLGVLAVPAAAPAADGGGAADARFKGTGKADPIRISNVKCAAASIKGEGTITFDLAWDHSWRAAWDVDEAQHGGKGKLPIENWDAAWVFVKFRLAGADGWRHATLSTSAADHTVPAGAKLDVGPTDDGGRGLGVFICRGAPGSGPIDWKGVQLRWRHGSDGVGSVAGVSAMSDAQASAAKPAAKSNKPKGDIAELPDGGDDSLLTELDEAAASQAVDTARKAGGVEMQVLAIRMVYVPESAFWAGDGTTNAVAGQFSAGDSRDPFRIESEAALTLGGADRRNLGNRDNVFATDDFSSSQTRFLSSAFPKGHGAFYCMRQEVTRGDMAALLNTLSSAQQAAMKDFMGETGSERGITLKGSGALAKYEAGEPHLACSGLAWREALAFSAWAGLRPMTELEFEKACRGPIKPVSDEMAWGTASTNKVSDSDRVRAGASYWGILDLTGNLAENTVAVGRPIGRSFDGSHGEGRVGDVSEWDDFGSSFKNENRPDILAGRPGWWMLGGGMIWRGAANWPSVMRVSDRSSLTYIALSVTRPASCGFRAVRSVGAGRSRNAASQGVAQEDGPQGLFNEQLRIANVAMQPGDGKTATIKFDIAWDESWRNATNHDAAWVFFKARTAGATNWAHVKVAADKVLNPTGYGQETGTKLEFVVPDGLDGFTGVFLQRAAPGTGPISAKGVTVVCDAQSLNTESRTLNTSNVQVFGIEMVFVPEGPFYLGSGGTEPDRFYQYTDGSQDSLPYPVTDAGPIPTGPQEGRLWATGVQPDGSDAGEIPAAFPNGFRAFYCMKYQLKMGQFAGFLGMQSEVRSFHHACKPGNGMSVAKVAWAFLQGVTWEKGIAFGAWAGLRPMTELEFEKAWRGPRKPVPDEIGPGYWGIRELASDGLVQRMVSVGRPDGLQFAGTHGNGSTSVPKDWPQGRSPAIAQRGDDWEVKPSYGDGVAGTRPSIRRRVWAEGDTDSWRGVRTAPGPMAGVKPGTGDGGFKLELEPLPAMGDTDIAIFHLAGKFHNAGDQALSVELVSPLPDACFPDGAASRAFTAAPKSATAFKILTVVTRQTARAVRRVQSFPVSVRKKGGEVLAEMTGKLKLSDPMLEKTPVIGTLNGGKLTLRVSNSSGQPRALTLELQPPPEIVMAETVRRSDAPVGEKAVAEFAASRRDASVVEGFYRIPYRVVPANGVAQAGVAVAEVRLQSRWWVSQREVKTGPALEAGGDLPDGGAGDVDLGVAGLDTPKANPADAFWKVDSAGVFKAGGPPNGWQSVAHGAALWPRALKPVPQGKTIISAATRIIAPADHAAILKFGFETDGWTWLDNAVLATIDGGSAPGFYPPPMRVWLNGEVVRDSRPGAQAPAPKFISLKKGVNTMLIQFETGPDAKGQLPHMLPLFHDAKDGAPIPDLPFDMEVKP